VASDSPPLSTTTQNTAELRDQVLADDTVPAPVRAALEKGLTLEDIRLDAQGRWWHAGQIIEHPRIHELFSRSVDETEGGTHVLKIWRFTYPITVEDTPYFVTGVRVDASAPAVTLRLNDGSEEALPSELTLSGENRLVARVKEGRFEARFLRTAYHDLLQLAEEEAGGAAIVVGDVLLSTLR